MPPSKPANPGFMPELSEVDSTSEAAKMRTAPFVEASIQAYASGFRQHNSKKTKRTYCYPRDEALVETCYATSIPDMLASLKHRLRPVGSHLGFKNLQGLAKGGYLHS